MLVTLLEPKCEVVSKAESGDVILAILKGRSIVLRPTPIRTFEAVKSKVKGDTTEFKLKGNKTVAYPTNNVRIEE